MYKSSSASVNPEGLVACADETGSQKYRTTNWKTYNGALKAGGLLLVWLDPTMKWHGQPSGRRGRSKMFSDQTI